MSSYFFCAIITLATTISSIAAQNSCKGRCGTEYYRGYSCQCDYGCLVHDECCKDYESQCTTRNSCKGRCNEAFKRGRQCNCDSDCGEYNQCCLDYKTQCEAADAMLNEEAELEKWTPAKLNNEESADDPLIPLVTPVSDPHGDVNNDVHNDLYYTKLPDDPVSDMGQEDHEMGLSQESTSGSEPTQADLTELIPTVIAVPFPPENPESDVAYKLSTISPHTELAPTESSDNRPTNVEAMSSASDTITDQVPTHSSGTAGQESQPTKGSETGATLPTVTTHSSGTTGQESQPTKGSETGATLPTVTTHSSGNTGQESQPTKDSETGATFPQASTTSTATSQDFGKPTPSSTVPTGPVSTDNTPNLQTGQTLDGNRVDADPIIQDTQDVEPSKPSSDQSMVLLSTETTEPTPSTTRPVLAMTTAAYIHNVNPNIVPETTGATQGSSSSEPNAASITTTIPTASISSGKDQTTISEDAVPGKEEDAPTHTVLSPLGTKDPVATESQARGTVPPPETVVGPHSTVSPDRPVPENNALSPLPPSRTAPTVKDEEVKGTPAPTKPEQSKPTSKPQARPNLPTQPPIKPNLAKPTSEPKPKPVGAVQTATDDTREYQADNNDDTNICSGRPVSGVTTLRNGTLVVFRGHYFWILDRNRVPGPARGITQVWGVPSPIDTVFTRCNCQGKTYIFKGPMYWRFDNDVVDHGYPKPIRTGFDGLHGQITAALSVPQYQRRRESVYFFKRGGMVQKYSYHSGTSPTCGRKRQYAIITVRNRLARQAVSHLEPSISIRRSWRGFPTAVTSAVSVPSHYSPEGYKYYVFSRSQYYSVGMGGGSPAIIIPQVYSTPQTNSASSFFKCPEKV